VRRRAIAAVAAVVSAVIGAVLLVGYVSGADRRAEAGTVTTTVLVAKAEIPQGTSANALTSLVASKSLPRNAVTAGALTSLSQVAGKVTTADVLPGEQLLAGRFGAPAAVHKTKKSVKVPAGMQQLSVVLPPERVVGGALQAGDHVGVFVSVTEPDQTHLVLKRVLVTRVQGAVVPATQNTSSDTSSSTTSAADSNTDTSEPLPTANQVVTLAVNGADAETIVFGVEHGSLWLSLDPAHPVDGGTRIVTKGNVYK
jgi:pilus assembly protein CpaB